MIDSLTTILFSLLAFWISINLLYAVVMTWRSRHARQTPFTPYTIGEGAIGIVLIHGFADTGHTWRREAAYLTKQGFRVSVISLDFTRGLNAWVNSIRQAHAALSATGRPVWFVGHSLGGAVAMIARMRIRGPIAGCFLWAPYFESRLRLFLPIDQILWLHRHLLWTSLAPTLFPVTRQAHGEEEGSYRVSNVISRRAYGAIFQTATRARIVAQVRLESPETFGPLGVLLPYQDLVVVTKVTRELLTGATIMKATSERSSHSLPNAADWRENTDQMITFIQANTQKIQTSTKSTAV